MTELQVERLVKLYRKALIILAISTGLALLSVIAEVIFLQTHIFVPLLIGGGIFSPYIVLVGNAVALPGTLWLYNRANRLSRLQEDQTKLDYEKIWNIQQALGVLVSIGAVIMVPGAVIAAQMGLPGIAILLSIFGGSWVFSQARKLDREIKTEQMSSSSAPNAELETNVYAKSNTADPNKTKNAGIVLLFAAVIMLAINILIEFSLVRELRGTPEFYGADSRLGNAIWNMGFAGAADFLVFGTLGIAVIVLALRSRKQMTRNRFIAILAISIVQLAFVNGSLTETIAKALGPSQAGISKQNQIDEAQATYEYLISTSAPEGFVSDGGEPFAEDQNIQWGLSVNTGKEAPIREKCTAVVDYAFGLGASDWMRKDTRETGKVADRDSTIKACEQVLDGYPRLTVKRVSVYSDSFVMGGVANFAPNSPLTFDLSLMNTDPKSESPNTFSFELYISTAYGMDPVLRDGDLSKGAVEVNELLNIIGQARLANPDRNPTDPAFMREILATYKFEIKTNLFESKPGVADRIELTDSDGFHMCLSVEPWDEKKMAQPDPGWGYGLAGANQSLSELNGFGNYIDGSCKN
jgi:hypothetical protein